MNYLPPEIAGPRLRAVIAGADDLGITQQRLAFHTGVAQAAWSRARNAPETSRSARREDMLGDDALETLAGLFDAEGGEAHGDALMALAGREK